ncbi:3-oxo-5-alpha-steroid 4-dehydrogenase 2-like [Saccostrea cucullata]|uniref:3-oxo-5-alpha-steroid 4-dehydrogenase 2-like n=1 Tax=Saccostrea cuccullata TaxID=36930 RepID=UPI002ECFAEC7
MTVTRNRVMLRAIETFIFLLRIKVGKHIPLFPFVVADFFCSVNSALQTYGIPLSNTQIHHLFQKAMFYFGLLYFFTGMYINNRSDSLLKSLRREKEGTYQTLRGFLFEYVSGCNFLGEIVKWIWFSVACCNLPFLAFAVFTLCNIGPWAYHHHRFYREKFEDYPEDREALIPFLLEDRLSTSKSKGSYNKYTYISGLVAQRPISGLCQPVQGRKSTP